MANEAERAAREALLGVWALRTYEDRESQAEAWTMTFGSSPTGLAVYHSSGVLSMQVFAGPDSSTEPDHVGYIGTFAVQEPRRQHDGFVGTLHHLMQSASDPALLVEDSARPFSVAGDRLTLGDGQTWRRVFERVV